MLGSRLRRMRTLVALATVTTIVSPTAPAAATTVTTPWFVTMTSERGDYIGGARAASSIPPTPSSRLTRRPRASRCRCPAV